MRKLPHIPNSNTGAIIRDAQSQFINELRPLLNTCVFDQCIEVTLNEVRALGYNCLNSFFTGIITHNFEGVTSKRAKNNKVIYLFNKSQTL